MALTSIELYDRVLKGERISCTDIEHMMAAEVREDLHLDWKGGKLIPRSDTSRSEKRSKTQKIRAAVAGFANAEGGVLVLGVNGGDVGNGEEPWTISRCPLKVGGHTVVEWLEDVLVELRPNLKPRPLVAIDGGEIVLIPVERSDLLVQCIEPGEGVVHYLRFYGSTQRVPPYLLADLLLGRRQRPQFELEIIEPHVGPRSSGRRGALLSGSEGRSSFQRPWPVTFRLRVHNVGLVWAEGVGCSVVHYAQETIDRHQTPWADPPVVDVPSSVERSIAGTMLDDRNIEHVLLEGGDIRPFQILDTEPVQGGVPSMFHLDQYVKNHRDAHFAQEARLAGRPVPQPARLGQGPVEVRLRMPVCVTSKNGLPQWFQAQVAFDEQARVIETSCSVEAVEGLPEIALRTRYRPTWEDRWTEIVGLGADPLAPV